MAKQNQTGPKDKLAASQRRHHTQWGAQFLVAAELERRLCTVSFTMGHNTPVADLMVASPSGNQFAVDVKGLSGKNSWNLRQKTPRQNLFYILVYFPPNGSKNCSADRFFILTQAEADQLVTTYQKNHPGDTGKAQGFAFNDPAQYEGDWSKLPQ
jgi:hypothetical protein